MSKAFAKINALMKRRKLMSNLKNLLFACVGLTALIVFLALVAPTTSQGQGGPPTQNVNVVNTPTVNAEQSGTWSVDITGTSSVQVVNPLDSPVLGRDVDQPARHAFQRGVVIDFATGKGIATAEFTVPANKRLVVEYVSAHIILTEGVMFQFSVHTSAGDSTGSHFFAPMSQANFPDNYTISQQTRLYASPGSTVTIEARRTFNPNSLPDSGLATISGYLVDM
jgi:hypothetical protein